MKFLWGYVVNPARWTIGDLKSLFQGTIKKTAPACTQHQFLFRRRKKHFHHATHKQPAHGNPAHQDQPTADRRSVTSLISPSVGFGGKTIHACLSVASTTLKMGDILEFVELIYIAANHF